MSLLHLEEEIMRAAASLKRVGATAPVSCGRSADLVLRLDGQRQLIGAMAGQWCARVTLLEITRRGHQEVLFSGFDVAPGGVTQAAEEAARKVIAKVREVFADRERLWSYACNPHMGGERPAPVDQDDHGEET